jgi:hypothetical protein
VVDQKLATHGHGRTNRDLGESRGFGFWQKWAIVGAIPPEGLLVSIHNYWKFKAALARIPAQEAQIATAY